MKNKIYVGNLPFDTTEDKLRNEFGQFGDIKKLVLIKDRDTGKSRGFAFITFADDHEAQSALKMNGFDLEGRNLRVNIAQEKEFNRG